MVSLFTSALKYLFGIELMETAREYGVLSQMHSLLLSSRLALPLRHKVAVEVVQQEGNAIPSHFAALVVKIKVVVFDLWIIEDIDLL